MYGRQVLKVSMKETTVIQRSILAKVPTGHSRGLIQVYSTYFKENLCPILVITFEGML